MQPALHSFWMSGAFYLTSIAMIRLNATDLLFLLQSTAHLSLPARDKTVYLVPLSTEI
jgi:hypothetical protein